MFQGDERTYDYCDTLSCGINKAPKTDTEWTLYPLKNREEIHILLGMDDSCNLQCPSCRLKKID